MRIPITVLVLAATFPLVAAEVRIERNASYAGTKHERQRLDLHAPAEGKDHPVVVWIHGGGWQAGSKADVGRKPQVFVDRGYVFVSVGYRLLPDATIRQMAEDVAKAIRWVHVHAARFGGDPQRMFVMGHSAGAQLAALVCTDDRYLKAEGLSLAIIEGCVPVDGDTYDVPLQIETVSERIGTIYRRKFGDAATQRDLSPVTHVSEDKQIPPFLILHVAEHPETTLQSKTLGAALKKVGVRARAYPAEGKDHGSINDDLGEPGDQPTKVLFDFVDGVVASDLRRHFGRQQYQPQGGFLLRTGARLPDLVWESPSLVSRVVDDPAIPTRWFNERFEEVQTADEPGRYYAYGEAPVPTGPPLRRAMTCCCIRKDVVLGDVAEKWVRANEDSLDEAARQRAVEATLSRWTTSEEGAVELAAWLDEGRLPSRRGQWQMENATRHVQLKRKLMGTAERPTVDVSPRRFSGPAAPVLRNGPQERTGFTEERVRRIERKLDAWYADSREPMAVVIAHEGVIVVDKAYGSQEGKAVTVDTPMLLHSAMKPLIGVQLATYVDRGHVTLDEPIGNHLTDFDTPRDRHLTFRAGHVHATGIHFPWDLAFRRLFYFHTWHESLIAHCPREWEPGARHRYGVVGVVLSVRAIELLRGRNYWDAMERDLFEPMGIENVLPGGTGVSARGMAKIGVLLDNHGRYGDLEFFSESTYRSIVPTSLRPHFPNLKMTYGIGLKTSNALGAGGYGHGGGCGTQLLVNPDTHLVFAMVRNDRGKRYREHLAELTALLRDAGDR